MPSSSSSSLLNKLISDVQYKISVDTITLLDPTNKKNQDPANNNNDVPAALLATKDIQENPDSYAFQLRWFVSDVLKGASPFIYETEKSEDGKEVRFEYYVNFELENAAFDPLAVNNKNNNNNNNNSQQPSVTVSHLLQLSVVACSKKCAKSIEAGFTNDSDIQNELQILGVLMIDLNAHTPKKKKATTNSAEDNNNVTSSSKNNTKETWKASSQKAVLYLSRSPLTPPPLMKISIRGEPVYYKRENNDNSENDDEDVVNERNGNDLNDDVNKNKENLKSRSIDSIASPIPVKPRTYNYQQSPSSSRQSSTTQQQPPHNKNDTSSRSGSKQQQIQQPTNKKNGISSNNNKNDADNNNTDDLVKILDEIQNDNVDEGPQSTAMTVDEIINFDFNKNTTTKNLLIAFETSKKQLRALTEQNELQRRENVALQRRTRLQQDDIKKLKEQVSEVGVGRVRAVYESKLMEMKEEINSLAQANLDLRSMSQSAEILADSLAMELEQSKYEAREAVEIARDSQIKLDEYIESNEKHKRAIKHGQEEITKLHSYCAQAKNAFEDALQALQKEKMENAVNKRRVEDLQKLLDASRLIKSKERETILPLR